MPMLEIKLKDTVTGKIYDVELPDDVELRDLLPTLAEKTGLQDTGGHKLRNSTKGFEYNENDTLAGRGTEQGDKCEIAYEPEFGLTHHHACP